MNTVNLKINNIPVAAPEGATILEAAHLAGIRIPAPAASAYARSRAPEALPPPA